MSKPSNKRGWAHIHRSTRKKNAQRGAITRWCPECKRKAALGQLYGMADPYTYHVHMSRECKYCGHIDRLEDGDRLKLYREWEQSKEGENE